MAIDRVAVTDYLEHHHPPLSLAPPAPPSPTLVVRTADLSLPTKPTFLLAPTLDEEALVPEDVLLVIRIGFCGATNLRFGGGMVLDPELVALRKEAEEIFCFLFKEGATLRASVSPLALDAFRASSESDTRMGIGIFSAPFVMGPTSILVDPGLLAFFLLSTGCRLWDFLLALDRELAPPLEELVRAMHCFGGLLLELVA